MSNEMDKSTSGNTVIISSTVLGQKRAEYQRLKDKGIAEDRITERMTEDALQFGITLENYQTQLNNLKSKSSGGEQIEEKRKEHTAKLQSEFLDYLGYANGVTQVDWKKVQFSKDNFKKLVKFLAGMGEATDKLITSLQNTEFTQKRGKQAWMVMLHAPVHNHITDKPTNTKLLAPFCGGWTDKGRSYDQYGIRMEASGAATFYRPVSYETPVKTTGLEAPASDNPETPENTDNKS